MADLVVTDYTLTKPAEEPPPPEEPQPFPSILALLDPDDRPVAERMFSYLPAFMARSRIMASIMDAQGAEFDAIKTATAAIVSGSFVRLSTEDWQLERWEQFVDLPPAPNETVQERQDRIVSKLRGFGTVTKALVQSVTSSYVMGETTVEDQNDDATLVYTVRITFTDELGIPTNFADLEIIVRQLIPAHLQIEYVFTYNTWHVIDAQAWTWDEVDTLDEGTPHTWDEFEKLQL